MPDRESNHPKDILISMGHLSHAHRRKAHEMMEQHGISMGQPPILRYLSDHDGCIQRDLAESCFVKAASISSVLDNMEQLRYIERRSLKGDRRVQQVFLTDLGREKHLIVRQVFEDLEPLFLSGITEEELQTVRTVLNKIHENLNRGKE